MSKPILDLNNPMHQYILVKLTLLYYTDGDVKGVYEDEELFNAISDQFNLGRKMDGTENGDWDGFTIMGGFLGQDEISSYYETWEYLKVMPDISHMG